MQFQNPTFLWALGILAIPVIIHLFNLRRHKTVYFSDIKFLKDVQQSTKKQRTLKEWLILLSRLLAFVALVFAFAKPFIPSATAFSDSNRTVIVLDNSPSTLVGMDEISPFEKAKKMALQLLRQLPEQAEIALVSASTSNELEFQSKQNVLEQLKSMAVVDKPLNFEFARTTDKTSYYFISDLQKNELDFLNQSTDSAEVLFIPVGDENEAGISNVAIDSIWAETPFLIAGQPITVNMVLKNYSINTADVNLEILVNDLPEITLTANLKGQTDSVLQANLSQLNPGFNNIQFNILNDEVSFDNRFLQSYFLPLSNNVVELYDDEPSKIISKIFSGDEFDFQSIAVSSINNEWLERADLIIVNSVENLSTGLISTLITLAQKSNLFLIPSEKSNQSLNDLASKLGAHSFGTLDTSKLRTQQINVTDPFFEEVFSGSLENTYWPSILKHYRLSKSAQLPSFNLMTLANGDPLFTRIANKSTNVFQLAVPLNTAFSDITTHPVIVPLFIKALLKKDNISNLTGTVGMDSKFYIELLNSDSDAPINLKGVNQDFIPRQQIINTNASILVGEELTRSGVYAIYQNNMNAGFISFNIASQESDINHYSVAELRNLIDKLGLTNTHIIEGDENSIQTKINEFQQGTQLWKYCLLLALIFILVEVILLRFLK